MSGLCADVAESRTRGALPLHEPWALLRSPLAGVELSTLANPCMLGELARAAAGEDWRYLQADDGRLGLSAGGHALRTLRRWAAQRACAPVRWGVSVQRACDQLWLPLMPVRRTLWAGGQRWEPGLLCLTAPVRAAVAYAAAGCARPRCVALQLAWLRAAVEGCSARELGGSALAGAAFSDLGAPPL